MKEIRLPSCPAARFSHDIETDFFQQSAFAGLQSLYNIDDCRLRNTATTTNSYKLSK